MKDYDAALLKHRGENVLITRTKTVHLDKSPAYWDPIYYFQILAIETITKYKDTKLETLLFSLKKLKT